MSIKHRQISLKASRVVWRWCRRLLFGACVTLVLAGAATYLRQEGATVPRSDISSGAVRQRLFAIGTTARWLAGSVSASELGARLDQTAEGLQGNSGLGGTLLAGAVMFFTLALATFVSEDLACIGAGVLVAEGHASFLLATLACFVGIVVGDLLLFLSGRWIGRSAVQRAPLKWFLSPESLRNASLWLERNGAVVIATSRFTPGTRLPTYVAAGALHTPLRRFLLYFAGAAALWTPLIVGVSAGLGTPFMKHGLLAKLPLAVKLPLAGVVMFVVVRLVAALVTYRGRRGLVGRWKRLLRWEFWPPYVFYPPVILYLAWLAIKFRSATLFTAANPGIPASGFVGESKAEILQNLREASMWLPRSELIRSKVAAERVDQAVKFMRREQLGFPIVLKPDAGQRGSGVAVIRSEDQLVCYLERTQYPAIAQEHVSGREFGVFYCRYPGQEHGRIFSITEKQMPVLTGDGKHTVEELILADDRAVCMADFYLRKNVERTAEVPGAGEPVQLVEIGTHCRGAIFLDGSHAITPALEDTIDRIAHTFERFYFGRFDIRVPTLEDFMAGQNLKVIELNGVTSEATHIYDPKLSLWQAYGVLFRQWRMAFEIGDLNRKRGVQPTPAFEMIGMLRDYSRLSQDHPA